MSTYHKQAQVVNIWYPIYDLAVWYKENTDNGVYQKDLVKCLGRPPIEPSDSLYQERSPSKKLDGLKGPMKILVNVGLQDKTTPQHHGVDVYNHIKNKCTKCTVSIKPWDHGHEFKNLEMTNQVLGEDFILSTSK